MMQLVHGGDWAGYRAQYGQDALDFSANVSPLGLPEGVQRPSPPRLPPQTAILTPSAALCGQSWQCTKPCPQRISCAATAQQT
mgnify:CR=1 FL=1